MAKLNFDVSTKGVKETKQSFESLSKSMGEAAKNLKSIGSINVLPALGVSAGVVSAGLAGMGAAASAAASKMLGLSDALDNQAKATQAGVESLQVFNLGAEQAGASAESITGAIQRLQKSIGEGTKITDAAFARLGLSVGELKALRPEDQFRLVFEQLGTIPDAATKAATSMALLGKSGANLLALSGDTLPKLEQRMRDLGLVIDSEAVAAADRLEEQLDFLQRVAGATWTQLGAGITSSQGLSIAVSELTDLLGQLNTFVVQNRSEIGSWVTAGILTAASAIQSTLTVVGAFVTGIGILGETVLHVEKTFVDWSVTLLKNPLSSLIPGIGIFREQMLSVAESLSKNIGEGEAFFQGIQKVGIGIDQTGQKVGEFRQEILAQIAAGEKSAAALDTVAERTSEVAERTSNLTAVEKTRIAVLSELIELQKEQAENMAEAAFQAEALADAYDRFPDRGSLVSLSDVIATPGVGDGIQDMQEGLDAVVSAISSPSPRRPTKRRKRGLRRFASSTTCSRCSGWTRTARSGRSFRAPCC
jgi:hypothetical protein